MVRKRVNKSKEQLLWEMEQKKHREKMQPFIDGELMPFLEENTQNLEEAQFLTESLQVAMNQAFEMQKKTMLLSELKMGESLAKVKNPKAVEKHVKLIEILEGQTVDDAVRLLSAVYEEANRVIMKQLKEKKLTDFKDGLPKS